MARLGPDEELAVREAVDRQSRGAVAVRPAQNTTAAVNVSQVAEVEAKADLHEEAGPPQPPTSAEAGNEAANGTATSTGASNVTSNVSSNGEIGPSAPPPSAPASTAPGGSAAPTGPATTVRPAASQSTVVRPGVQQTRPGQRPGSAPSLVRPVINTTTAKKPVKPVVGPKRPGRDKEEVLSDIEREALQEQIEMGSDVVGPPAPAVVAFTPGKLVGTVDLTQVEETGVAPPPQARRRAVVNVGGRQIRTLQRRRSRGPKVSLQASQELSVQTPISLKEFSQICGVSANDMIKRLIHSTGLLTWNMNSVLDEEKVSFLAEAFARTVIVNEEQTAEDLLDEATDEDDAAAEGSAQPRAAVVAILGHVDHGKSSLLDRIRKSNRVAEEFGGITQHIGAFQVETGDGRKVTFLDTPGHAAFTSMRARGAQAADIVVLVIAADDGIMPQTEEAINHARAADCPIVVALNKIDKNNANPGRVLQELSAHGLTPEEWGGETIVCKVSALKGDGVPELIENLAALAEVLELKANPDAPVRGRVIESRKDPNRGVIATLLIEEGTLRKGDTIVAGMAMGRVRTMLNDAGKTVLEAIPSAAVEVFGLDDTPEAGDQFKAVEDERLARQAVDERKAKLRQASVVQREMPSLEKLFAQAAADQKSAAAPKGLQDLKVILKCDVKGSLEPVKGEIAKLAHPEVRLDVLYSGLGAVTKSDVDNAVAAGAIVMGFHVLTEPDARREAERTGVEIRHYTVIYELVDDLRAAMERRLAPDKKEHTTGHSQVRAVFQSSKVGTIAGCFVIDGTIHRSDFVRVYRDGRLIYGQEKQIPVDSIKRFKDDVREVREGFECGVRIATYQDVKQGDVLEFYEIREESRKLLPA
ncbi:MAG: translation initiation factor IF-2 [Planctomycetes bacterium]|nr:translation initiation factor IF-2 [Planctomycetota bacterium]